MLFRSRFPSARRFALAALAALVSLPAGFAADSVRGPRTGRWAHEVSELRPESHVIWGRLDNGFRYALRPHDGIPGQVALRFMVLTGSMDEAESERGIAHFLEHLAFRTTEHFSAERQVEFFQSLGMDPNSDINAVTRHNETVYMMECREATPTILDQMLLWIRGVADGIAFRPEEIDEERGVILSELRVRGGLMAENLEAGLPVLFKGLRFPAQGPSGTPDVIRRLQREDFIAFYRRNYRADQMILVAVGDFDPPTFEQMVRDHFASLARPTTPLPARNEGELDMSRSLRAGVFRISNVGSAHGTVGYTSPAPDRPDSRQARIDLLRREFAFDVFSHRVAKAVGGSASLNLMFGYYLATVEAMIDPENWAHDLNVLDDLVRFTVQRGFEQREIDMIKRRYVAQTEFLLEHRTSMDPAELADRLVESISRHQVFVGLETELKWQREWLANLNRREINEAFAACWDLDRMAFLVAGDVEIEGGAGEVVKKIEDARRSGLRNFRPETRRVAEFKLPSWGKPGEVVERREVPELGATLLRFNNNVHLNFIPTRASPGIVHILARFGTGLLEMPEDQPALKEVGVQTVLSAGTTHFTSEHLAEIIEDHVFGIGFDLDENDAFAFRAAAAPDKIEVPLAIMTDFMKRPIFGTFTHREEKIKAVVSNLLGGGGMGDGERQLQNYLFRGDPRFTWVTDAKDYLGLSTRDVRSWLEEPLTRGYLEVTIVGDTTEEAVTQAVARTLGELPRRAERKTLFLPPKPVRISAPPGFRRIEFVGEQHIGQAAGIWPIEEKITVRDQGALLVLTKVLEQHVYREIRSRLGLAYSPSVGLQRFSGFQEFALIHAQVDCDPAEASRVAKLLEDIAVHLATGGLTESEFTGARGTLSSQIRSAIDEPGFLINMIRRAQENPESLEGAIKLKQGLIDEITHEEVNAWAKRILTHENSRTAAIVPKPFIGIFQTGQ